MGFFENKNKFNTHRFRFLINKIKHPKSSIRFSNIMKPELSIIKSVSPIPLPVLSLSSSISHRLVSSTFLEGVIGDSLIYQEPFSSIKSNQEHQEAFQSPTEAYKIEIPMVLDHKRLLASPIQLSLASSTQFPSYLSTPASASKPNLHRDSLTSHTSTSFTPELDQNLTGINLKHTTSTLTLQSNEYFEKNKSRVHQSSSRSSSPTSVYSEKSLMILSTKDQSSCFTHQKPIHEDSKWVGLPARRFLPREGLIPTRQPLSSKLLKPIVTYPSKKPLSLESKTKSLNFNTELDHHLNESSLDHLSSETYDLEEMELEIDLLNRNEGLGLIRDALLERSSYSSLNFNSLIDLTDSGSNS
ncbi:hypothetical protein DFH28DRAFT_969352 [Melampsora americana]|nr:hypothetical protein DFH28DRAFT_969352 [Melampsora americana]